MKVKKIEKISSVVGRKSSEHMNGGYNMGRMEENQNNKTLRFKEILEEVIEFDKEKRQAIENDKKNQELLEESIRSSLFIDNQKNLFLVKHYQNTIKVKARMLFGIHIEKELAEMISMKILEFANEGINGDKLIDHMFTQAKVSGITGKKSLIMFINQFLKNEKIKNNISVYANIDNVTSEILKEQEAILEKEFAKMFSNPSNIENSDIDIDLDL